MGIKIKQKQLQSVSRSELREFTGESSLDQGVDHVSDVAAALNVNRDLGYFFFPL